MNGLMKSKIEIERAESELKSVINMLDECFTLDELRIQENELNTLLNNLDIESQRIRDLINMSGNEI